MSTTIYVQFKDSTKTEVISVFSCKQDSKVFPYQGVVQENDERLLAFYSLNKQE